MVNFMLKSVIISFSLHSLASAALYNDVCGPLVYCNVTAGLICENNRCACPKGRFSENQGGGESYSYILEWDSTRNLCVGTLGSVCISTRLTSVPEGMKKVECVDGMACIQIPKRPLGVGLCKNVPRIFHHGTLCNETAYCDSSRGLICTDNTCTCSTTEPNTLPSYNLIWDEELSTCLAEIGSACIGTKEAPLAAGQKMIKCVAEAKCTENLKYPPGVGTCNSAKKLHNQMITTGLFVLLFFFVSSL